MKIHILKIHPEYFKKVWDREKTFELRKNDRDFRAGDALILKEFPDNKKYGIRSIGANICYILEHYDGIEEGYCILQLNNIINNNILESKDVVLEVKL